MDYTFARREMAGELARLSPIEPRTNRADTWLVTCMPIGRKWNNGQHPEKKGEDLVWGRHEISAGDRVVIVEDVANNFSTTEKLIKLIWQGEGTPVAIATYLNRSLTVRATYDSLTGLDLPICALVNEPWPEYRQDDPAVAADIAAGNIEWEVKKNWSHLLSVMRAG